MKRKKTCIEVNSPTYWNKRFQNNWEDRGGPNQTVFFAALAMQNTPVWLKNEINLDCLSVFDFGCAQGDALKVLASEFPKSGLAGGDVAISAIKTARSRYPEFKFEVLDPERPKFKSDVTFCSNTLEHFADWAKRLELMADCTKNHLIVMAPFQETELHEEHEATFDFNSLPFSIGAGLKLSWLSFVDTFDLPNTRWNGRQFVAIWSKKRRAGKAEFSDRSIDFGSSSERDSRLIQSAISKIDRVAVRARQELSNANHQLEQTTANLQHYEKVHAELQTYSVNVATTIEQRNNSLQAVKSELKKAAESDLQTSQQLSSVKNELKEIYEKYLQTSQQLDDTKSELKEMRDKLAVTSQNLNKIISHPTWRYFALLNKFYAGGSRSKFNLPEQSITKNDIGKVHSKDGALNNSNTQQTVILQVENLNRGGLERVVADLAYGLKFEGKNVVVVAVNAGGDIANDLLKEGFDVRIIGSKDLGDYRRVIADLTVEAVIAHHSYFGLRMLRDRGAFVVETIHNYYTWFENGIKSYSEQSEAVHKHVAVSNGVAEFHSKKFGIDRGSIEVISNPLNTTGFIRPGKAMLQRARNLRGSTFEFLHVSQFHPSKAHMLLLSAMEQVLLTHPNARLKLVGEHVDQELSKLISYRIRKNPKLKQAVEFTGFHDRRRLSIDYASANSFVMPSVYEGCSIAVLEATFFGLPLILTDIGNASEMIHDEDFGIIIPAHFETLLDKDLAALRKQGLTSVPDNLNHLVNAMRRMIDEREKWSERGFEGQSRLNESTVKNVAQSYSKLISKFLGATRDR